MTPRARRWSIALFVTFYVVATVAGVRSYQSERHLSESWATPAALACLLTLIWPADRAAYPRFVGAVGGLAALFVLVAVPAGLPVGEAARIAVVTAVTMVALLAAYRSFVGDWFPRRTEHVVAYAALSAAAAVAGVLLGGVPGAGLGGTGELRWDLAWLIRSHIHLVFTGMINFALFHFPRPTYSRIEYRSGLGPLAVLAAACLVLPYLYPTYPLAWLVCVPWVWLGLALTPRIAGGVAMVIVIGSAAVARSTFSKFPPDAWLPPALVMEELNAAALLLAFIILALRENTARLSARTAAAARRAAHETELLAAVVEAVEDGVLLADRRGQVAISNPAARRMLGRPTTPVGLAWPATYGLRDLDGADLDADGIAALLVPTRETVRVRTRAGGGERVYAVAVRALADGDPPRHLVVLTDVTAEHARHSELEAFAATVAHDLKNPLTSLALWMDIAETELADDPARGREALDRAQQVGGRMGQLIDDYLAYTVTREGALRPSAVDLRRVVAEVASMYDVGEQAAQIDLDIDAVVVADPALVRQLLANLLGNSVKYARPGQPPRIQVVAQADSEPGWVRISVADHGIGIDEADRERVFRPFSRTSQGAASGRSGIGLGLALCRSIVTRHGGRIEASANAWGGTTMTFTLPAARATARAAVASTR
ncbi:MAG: PAS domain-containing sensor histidine kinase [Actinobacteria bacterium]|nr:PAS domain-containing sensor histidine kinase [Actinomycetota bacterium]